LLDRVPDLPKLSQNVFLTRTLATKSFKTNKLHTCFAVNYGVICAKKAQSVLEGDWGKSR